MATLPPGKDIRLHHLLNYRYIILNILYIYIYFYIYIYITYTRETHIYFCIGHTAFTVIRGLPLSSIVKPCLVLARQECSKRHVVS